MALGDRDLESKCLLEKGARDFSSPRTQAAPGTGELRPQQMESVKPTHRTMDEWKRRREEGEKEREKREKRKRGRMREKKPPFLPRLQRRCCL